MSTESKGTSSSASSTLRQRSHQHHHAKEKDHPSSSSPDDNSNSNNPTTTTSTTTATTTSKHAGTPPDFYFYKSRNSLIDFDQLLPPVEVDMDALGQLYRSLRQSAAAYSEILSSTQASASSSSSTPASSSSPTPSSPDTPATTATTTSSSRASLKDTIAELIHKIQQEHRRRTTGADTDSSSPSPSKNRSKKEEKKVQQQRARERLHAAYLDMPSMEGFFNLALVLLLGAVLALMAENIVERGVLVNLSLLQCMVGDWWLGLLMVLTIYFMCIVAFAITQVNMKFVRPPAQHQQQKTQKERQSKSSKLQVIVYWLSISLYIVCQGLMLFTVCRIIFKQHVSLVVSMLATVTLMVYFMKIHSYFVYISKEYSPSHIHHQHKMHPREKDVTLEEYLYFLVSPTLCFFRYYPRTKKIRIFYFLEHALMGLGSVIMAYMIFMQYLDPIFQDASRNTDAFHAVAYGVVRASVPWFILWLIGSFALFHCFLNALAELTYFGDRLWYKDWWNADSFDTFWRNWNIPVHHWLLKHVYFESIRMEFGKLVSVMATFFLSGVLHEAVMAIMFRSLKLHFFSAMVIQVPAVVLGKLLQKRVKTPFRTRISNMLMWLSLFAGQPLLLLLYFRAWYIEEGGMCMA